MECLKEEGHLTEVEHFVLTTMMEFLGQQQSFHVDMFVYIRATPEQCYERVKSRGRAEEQGVTLEYLQSK